MLVWVTFGAKPVANGDNSATVHKSATVPKEPSQEFMVKKDDANVENVSPPTSPADQGKPGCYGITDDKVLYPSDAESDEQDDVDDATENKVDDLAPEVVEAKTVLYVPDSLSKPETIIIDPIDKVADLVEVQGAVNPVQRASTMSENVTTTTNTLGALKASLIPQVKTDREQSLQQDTVNGFRDAQELKVLKDAKALSEAEFGEPGDEAMDEEIHDSEWVSDMEPDVESSDGEDNLEPQQEESDSERISDNELEEVKQLAASRAYGVERQHQAYAHDEIVAKTIRIRELEDQLCKVQSKLSEVQGQSEGLEMQLAEKAAKLGTEETTRSKAELLTKELQSKVTELELELSKTKEEVASVKRCHTAKTAELADLESIFDSEMTNLRTAEAEIKSLKGQLMEKAHELEVMQEKYDDLMDDKEEVEADVMELNDEIENLSAQCDAKDKLLHHIKTVNLSPKDVKVQSSDENNKSAADKDASTKEIEHVYKESSAYEDGYDEGYIQGLRAHEDDADSDICSDCDDHCPKVACRISRSWDDGYEAGRQDGVMDADTDAAYDLGYEHGIDSVNEFSARISNHPAQLMTPAASPASAKKVSNVMDSDGSKSSDSEGEIATTSISPFKVLSPLLLKRKREEAASEQASSERPVKRTRKVLTIVAHAAIGALAGSIGTIAGLAALGGGQE